jgi:dissimilatory sulfite reductase (desulfoviridin) alpha/beta subunit
MFWFFRGLRKGVVTTRYPAQVDAWARELPSPPSFRSELLTETLADELVAVCPSGALRRENGTLVLDLGACTGCGRCYGEVARPSREFELATTDRSRLLKRIPIGGGA